MYDVNGDGLNDVVTALSAHGWGLAWFEQKRDAQGAISFVQHHIMGDFSEEECGQRDLLGTARRYLRRYGWRWHTGFPGGQALFSHLESYLDPDPYGPSVLYAYHTVRNPKAEGGAEFVPELIHNRSGVGSHLYRGGPERRWCYRYRDLHQSRNIYLLEPVAPGEEALGQEVTRMRVSAAFLLSVLLLPRGFAQTDWPIYGHDPGGQQFSPLNR